MVAVLRLSRDRHASFYVINWTLSLIFLQTPLMINPCICPSLILAQLLENLKHNCCSYWLNITGGKSSGSFLLMVSQSARSLNTKICCLYACGRPMIINIVVYIVHLSMWAWPHVILELELMCMLVLLSYGGPSYWTSTLCCEGAPRVVSCFL